MTPSQPQQIDADTAKALRVFLARANSRFASSGALLFGSRARGDHHATSDADLALLLTGEPGKFLATKLELADLAFEVLLETGIRIEPLPVWEREWAQPDTYANPRLLDNIAREGIRL
jgi:antitoxin ChpS